MAKRDRDGVGEFARLIRESHRELFGFIFTMLQNRADAEDVYQQTALVLWKKFADFNPGTNFTGWAIRVAQFEIKDYIKAQRRRKVFCSDAILDAIAVAYQAEPDDRRTKRMEALANCLEKLNDRDRRMLKQCYSVGRDYKKIAASEGKTIAAMYKAISRIRKALFNCIQQAMAAESHR